MINENKEISVIIPCYNCSKYIDETLSSLEQQVFKNFVVICVNDGSTDGTLEILNKWKEKGSLDIEIINQENGGVSKARNAGLKACRSKYITFCDSDDVYSELFLTSLYDAIERNEADAAYCYLTRDKKAFSQTKSKANIIDKNQDSVITDVLYNMGKISFDTFIYNSGKLKSERIQFDEDLKYGEDREFNWKYLANCKSIACVDRVLYFYRPNEHSATRKKATWRNTDALISVNRTYEYLKEKGCSFADEYYEYMYARNMWHVAKNYAVSRDKKMFNKLVKEFDVKACMKVLRKDNSMLVRLSSFLYLLKPCFFYFFVGLRKG